MKTNLAVVLVSLATSTVVNAFPVPQPNYDPTLQIPQSVFDFQTPNILTRSEGLWSDGTEFLLAESEPGPATPAPSQKQPGDPVDIPGHEDSQKKVVPNKDSGLNIPRLSSPDIHDTTTSQPPEINPTNKEGLGGFSDIMKLFGWWELGEVSLDGDTLGNLG